MGVPTVSGREMPERPFLRDASRVCLVRTFARRRSRSGRFGITVRTGVIPYSPPAGGVLTGKYSRDDLTATNVASDDGTRKGFNLALGALTERNLGVADVVKEVATELGRTPVQVGLAWTLRNPGVTTPIIGARTPAQLEDNLGALEVDFTAAQLARLDEASAIGLGFPHDMLASDHIRSVTAGDLKIETRRRSELRGPGVGRVEGRTPGAGGVGGGR